MTTFIFDTTTTMKDYNRSKWWIDSDVVPSMHIKADDLKTALKVYQSKVDDMACITISDNALKTKNPMYVDTIDGNTKQVGFVITGSADFQDERNYKWSKQYVDLWVTVETVIETDFEEV